MSFSSRARSFAQHIKTKFELSKYSGEISFCKPIQQNRQFITSLKRTPSSPISGDGCRQRWQALFVRSAHVVSPANKNENRAWITFCDIIFTFPCINIRINVLLLVFVINFVSAIRRSPKVCDLNLFHNGYLLSCHLFGYILTWRCRS